MPREAGGHGRAGAMRSAHFQGASAAHRSPALPDAVTASRHADKRRRWGCGPPLPTG